MRQLVWTRTRDGWSGGRYRIEFAAPRIWVLTKVSQFPLIDRELVTIVRSAPSAGWLKNVAARDQRTRIRRRLLVRRIAAISVALALLQIGISTHPVLIIPSAIVAVVVSLRSLVLWADASSDGAWARVSETYQ